ncbi:MAG: hypothetical protein WCO21_03205 [bacterium]
MQNKKNNMVVWGVIVVVVALVSFWAGSTFGAPKGQAVSQNGYQRTGGMNSSSTRRGGMQNAGFISGSIVSKDDKSITVKAQDGSSKFIFFSGTTKITKSTDGTATDLEIGKDVTANGTANSDGSVTAQTIQLRAFMPRPIQVQ